MPMDLKTRRYFQLIQDLNQKKRQQLAENVKFVGDLPQQLSGQKQENKGLPPTKLQDYVQLTDEELKKRIEEREQMVSPLEALIQQEAEDAEEAGLEGWKPFPAPRSKM